MENKTIHVLLVEDDTDHAELASRALKRANAPFELTIHTNYQAACEWLRENQPDVLITDLRLPDASGIDFLVRNGSKPKFPVIIITSQGDEQHAVEAMKAGALDYVVKSQDSFRELPHTIQRALREWETLQQKDAADEKLRSIFRAAPVGIGVVVNRILKEVNDTICSMTGYTREELIDQNARILYPTDEDYQYVGSEKYRQIAEKGTGTVETRWRRKNGEIIHIILSSTPLNPDDLSAGVTFTALDITERKKHEEALRKSEERFHTLVDASPNAILVIQDRKYVYANPASCSLLGYLPDELIGMDALAAIHPDDHPLLPRRFQAVESGKPNLPMEMKVRKKNGDIVYTESTSVPIVFNDRPAILVISHDITERKLAAEEIKRSHNKLEAAEKMARLGNYEIDMQTGIAVWSKEVFEIFGMKPEEGEPTVETYVNLIHPEDRQAVYSMYNQCAQEGVPFDLIYRIMKKSGETRYVHSLARVEMDETGKGNRMFGTFQDITERIQIEKALEESQHQIEERMKQLMVLRDIDIAITSYTNMHKIVNTILERISTLPNIGGAVLLISDVPGGQLKIAAQTGLEPPVSFQKIDRCSHLDIKQVVQMQVPVFINEYPDEQCEIKNHTPDEIRSCAILPLMVHEDFKGILLLLSPKAGLFDRTWQDFAHSLAMQTAIAIENAALFTEMQYKHLELMEAYEATIEGWSRTLEMRDKETKGHTERVTRLSLLLAVAFGYRDEELWNFRRGVLLHDIGKISIPDSILFKPGPLSDEEWIIMRQHPSYARQMLSGIAVLEKALDIPYCHHEKWDGSGYPRGLTGEAIPLSARIFAIVDVWDALTSDRPYRPAWTKEMARKYILDQSGKHFDPKVVEAFMNLLDSGKIDHR